MYLVREAVATWLVICAASALCFACALGDPKPGSFAVAFSWSDPAPSVPTWARARAVRGRGNDEIQVAETPLTLVTNDLSLAFASLPHGGPYRIAIEIKGSPKKGARTLYFGESKPFRLRPGLHVNVEVALALTAAPSAGALTVVEKNEGGFVRTRIVTLRLAPVGATHLTAANDFAMTKGRRELALEGLPRGATDYLFEWDLDAGACDEPPCADGRRSVFVQFENQYAYASEVVETSVNLDREAPDIAAASIAPSPARADVEITLVINPSEPLGESPRLLVSPNDPGFSPFERMPGGGYVASYSAPPGSPSRQQFDFAVALTDRANNKSVRELATSLRVDTRAPGLAWGAEVFPGVVRDREPFSLGFELDEVVATIPQVQVGDTTVECAFEGATQRRVRCTHVAARNEGQGERLISIRAQDEAGNVALLPAGSVLYDTLPRCGDGVRDALEACDQGHLNSNAPDSACRVSCRPRRCGDGIVDPSHGEECDDGNEASGDGCAGDCRSSETCGDRILETAIGEACDDGNLLSQDGCSSACEIETLNPDFGVVHIGYTRPTYDSLRRRLLFYWDGLLFALGQQGLRRVSTTFENGTALGSGTGSVEHIVYDVARDRVVAIGAGTIVEWDGIAFRSWPNRRLGLGAAVAYVGSKQHTLVFAGYDDEGVASSDLQAWNGSQLSDLTLTGGPRPAPRAHAAIVYDPKRDRVVLFGGLAESGDTSFALADTWEWDGARWHEQRPEGPIPPARSGHTMVYDPTTARVVLAAGADASETALDDGLWEWDGARWEHRSVSEPLGVDAALVADPGRQRLFIGTESHLWDVEPTHWISLQPDPHTPLYGHAVTYDAERGHGLLFGGRPATSDSTPEDLETYFDHTWALSGTTWTPLAIEGSTPPARAFAALVYDPLRQVTVLFGGETCTGPCIAPTPLSDTWELGAAEWRRIDVAGVSPDGGPDGQMVFDAARKRPTLFATSSEGVLAAWHWDGATWTQAPRTGDWPQARRNFSAAYDAIRERVVLFGGEIYESGNRKVLDDTWEWDGEVFQRMHPETSPSARSNHASVYHATRGSVILYGGGIGDHAIGDAWEWDGTTWRNLPSIAQWYGAAHGILGHRAFFDPQRHAAISIGGWARSASKKQPERWVHSLRFGTSSSDDADDCILLGRCPTPGSAEDSCFDDLDGDGDGLKGCDDPDCYGLCSPWCNPARMTCDYTLPHCGDGICTAAEHGSSCPSDCGTWGSVCGDSICSDGERPSSCPGDCP